jgi:DNA-directed RNA polymerase-5 subunit 1
MKTVAKGILKDHLVPVASNTTCTGNLNGFNNAGYEATLRPLKMPVPSYRVHLVYPYEMHEKTAERYTILIHWDVWSHHVRGASI